jgi:hypothetical protein
MRSHTAWSVVVAVLLLSLLLGPVSTDARVQRGYETAVSKKDQPNCSAIHEKEKCTPEGCIWCQNK